MSKSNLDFYATGNDTKNGRHINMFEWCMSNKSNIKESKCFSDLKIEDTDENRKIFLMAWIDAIGQDGKFHW